MSAVDLRELAIDRGETAGRAKLRSRRHLLTRYVLPLLLVCGFLLLVAWAAWDLMFPPKPVTVMPVISTTAAVRQEGTPLFKAAGWIEPRPTPVRVAALAPGVVEKLLVVEDQALKKGEPIAELVKDDAQLALKRALADLQLKIAALEEADAELKAARTRHKQPVHLEASLRDAEGALAKVKTQVEDLPFKLTAAEANEQAAKQDYDGKVASKGVVSGIAIDIAKAKWDAAKARVAELKRRESSLKAEADALEKRRAALKTQLMLLADETQAVERAGAKVKSAKAMLDQTAVSVEEAELRLERMTITSPIDGRVFQLIGHPGARVGSSAKPGTGSDGSTIVTMYRPKMLQIRVDVRFEDIPKVSLKQNVEIKNPALASPIIGKVLFISSEADIQKNTLQVKVAIPDPPAVFKPEMLVDVTFLAPKPVQSGEPEKELKLYVPRQLVVEEEGDSFVWVADQSAGVARKTVVKVGTSIGGIVEITTGLTRTSRLIVGGRENVADGERIEVTGEADLSSGETGSGRPQGQN